MIPIIKKLIQTGFVNLACIATLFLPVAVQAQITGTNQIAFTDFDTSIPGYSYGYFYSWGWPDPPPPEPGTYVVNLAYTDPSIDPTNGPVCIRFDFTNSAYEQLIATNAGAGYGAGFGGPQVWGFDPSVFNSIDLEDYLFSFDARVEGLNPGTTTANNEMQVQISAGPQILQKNLAYNPGSNWTHFSFTLADGTFANGTSAQTFTNNLSGITAVTFNNNNHLPNGEFGWTEPNTVFLDNLLFSVIQHSGPPPPPPPTIPFTILDWNLDDKPLWYSYGYNWSQNANFPVYSQNNAAAGYGVGGSNAWILTMDNSPLTAGPPQYAGEGTGGGGPANYAQFVTPDLSSYRISFLARHEGLAPDRTNTTTRLQLFVRAPDDTLQPPDGDLDNDLLIRLDFDITAGTNWESIVHTLKQGVVGLGSKANFSNYFAQITEVTTQFQIENAASIADWEYDANNLLVIDNIKLERLQVGCPPLNIVNNGATLAISWDQPSSGTAKLQSAAAVAGPYADVTGAVSPYVTGATNSGRYFRTQWVAP